MKRIGVWIFYGVGALAVAYLALYAYAAFKGRDLQPGDPIHIFRKPNAPDYSARTLLRANGSRECAPMTDSAKQSRVMTHGLDCFVTSLLAMAAVTF